MTTPFTGLFIDASFNETFTGLFIDASCNSRFSHVKETVIAGAGAGVAEANHSFHDLTPCP
jgi:hypothetical protein